MPPRVPSVAARSGTRRRFNAANGGWQDETTVSEPVVHHQSVPCGHAAERCPCETQLFDGQAMHCWTHGAKSGHTWHPAGLRVVPDIVQPLLADTTLPGRKRGAGTVAHAVRVWTAHGKQRAGR